MGTTLLGLAVLDLDETTAFLTDLLGWELVARSDGYPRTTATDGHARLALWRVDRTHAVASFDRKSNIGLHHLALEVATEAELYALAGKIAAWPGVAIEFAPKPIGTGPDRHMMFAEPGGIRIELNWPASWQEPATVPELRPSARRSPPARP